MPEAVFKPTPLAGEPGFYIAVDVSAFRRLAKAIPTLEKYIDEEIEYAMYQSGELMSVLVAVRTPYNYGLLRGSISWPSGFELEKPLGGSEEWRGIVGAGDDRSSVSGVSTSQYVWYVEYGTEPHFPPVRPLILWASRKFDLPDEEAKRFGYVLQQHIGKFGTPAVKMFERGWTEGGRETVSRIFAQVPVRALNTWRNAYPKGAAV